MRSLIIRFFILLGLLFPALDAAGAPIASLNAGALNFAAQDAGTISAAQTVLYGNIGSVPLNIASIAVSGEFALTHNCPTVLAPGSSCTLNLATYATGKGYDVLTTVNGGEGFWINAKTAFTAQLPTGTAISTNTFADQLTTPNSLPTGWSLIAIGDNLTPRAFVTAISATTPVAGVVPTSITTLWAWDSGLSSWYFYAPSLDNNGGLANYIMTKGYLDFTAKSKTLDPTTGFWMNHP